MKYFFPVLWVVLLVALPACRNDKEVIPRKDLIPILVDIHLMDGALQVARYNNNVNIPDTIDLHKTVLNEYRYTRAQFDSSMKYYSKDLKKFDRIYQEVLARLNQMETKVREQKEQEQQQEKTSEEPAEKPVAKK